ASVTGDEAVTVVFLLLHAKVGGAVRHQLVGLFERAFIEQKLDAFARRHLAFLVLALASLRTAALFGKTIAVPEFGKLLISIHADGLYGERRHPQLVKCN